MSKRMPLLLAVLVGVLGGALIAGSALVGASAAPQTTSPSTTAAVAADHAGFCGWRFRHLPDQLRADLKAARALPRDRRHAAVHRIIESGLAGKYGPRARAVLEIRQGMHRLVRSKLPTTLRADIVKARHLPAGQRRDAIRQIWNSALFGKYGEKAQRLAEHRKAHRDSCWDGRPASTTDGAGGSTA